MAPVSAADLAVWASSPEVGAASLVIFMVLAVTLLALCAQCRRNPGNTYDMNDGTTVDAGAGVGGRDGSGYMEWRDHRSMPRSTLDRQIPAAN